MDYTTLALHYKTNFNIIAYNGFGSLSEIENLIPFERDIYIKMIGDKDEEDAIAEAEKAGVEFAFR